LAEKALLRTADWYYANSEYDLAADAYAAYLKSYPRSPEVPRLRLRRAYATLAQFRGTRYDATPLIDARAQLVEIAAAYPEIAQDEGLMDLVRRIDDTFAQKVYRNADWYRRTNQPSAAVYNYRFLIATFPNTPEAKLAKERLAQFPAKVLAERPPRKGSGYAPATMPYPEER
jgi:outer membrane protein assembly factor BamD (BamD/ComL family)